LDSQAGTNQIQRWLLEAGDGGEVLRDDQWDNVKPFVPGGRKGKRCPRSDGRWFFDALLWMAGLLPERAAELPGWLHNYNWHRPSWQYWLNVTHRQTRPD
jgi:hypothetical protein